MHEIAEMKQAGAASRGLQMWVCALVCILTVCESVCGLSVSVFKLYRLERPKFNMIHIIVHKYKHLRNISVYTFRKIYS